MTKTTKISTVLTLFAVILAFTVVILGAYTRLTDAGLGCPDWPGCYSQLVAPHDSQQIRNAIQAYPNSPVHIIKAWTEMIHRYVAGILGLLIFALGIWAIRKNRVSGQPALVPVILMGLVIFQALLGKWTVTMKLLPIVVTGHLLGGLAILSLLWWVNLKVGHYFVVPSRNNVTKFKFWAIVGLIIVIIQIALGGWTSANYAALICPKFPYCSAGQFFPQMDFRGAFNIFSVSDAHLSPAALITIQMVHRIGAFITGVYVGLLGLILILARHQPLLQKIGAAMLIVLALQISLGVLNVEWQLPLLIALSHNAIAALLLLVMVTFLYVSFKRRYE